jgi:hypothetical protein
MSPSRRRATYRRRRDTYKPRRDRRELTIAVLSSLTIVIVTAVLIWTLRPNKDGGSSPEPVATNPPAATTAPTTVVPTDTTAPPVETAPGSTPAP